MDTTFSGNSSHLQDTIVLGAGARAGASAGEGRTKTRTGDNVCTRQREGKLLSGHEWRGGAHGSSSRRAGGDGADPDTRFNRGGVPANEQGQGATHKMGVPDISWTPGW
jgi:hypothetical protein